MNYREFIAIVAVIALAAIGDRVLGEWFRIGVFALLAGALVFASARLRRARRGSTEALAQLDEEEQDEALANVDARERVELLRRVGRRLPEAELVAEQEVFEYPRALRRTIGITLALDAAMLAATAAAAVVSPPAGWVDWLAMTTMLAAFGVAGAWLLRYLGDLRARIVASEAGLERVGPRRTVQIAWDEATHVQNRDAFEVLIVGARDGRRIRVHQRIDDFGRLLELVETRAAAGSLRIAQPDGAVAWPLEGLRSPQRRGPEDRVH